MRPSNGTSCCFREMGLLRRGSAHCCALFPYRASNSLLLAPPFFFRCHLAALPKYTYDIRSSRRQCASDSLRSEEAGAEGFRSLYECLGTSILGYSAANDVLGV